MQFTHLTTLLLATLAIAAPVPENAAKQAGAGGLLKGLPLVSSLGGILPVKREAEPVAGGGLLGGLPIVGSLMGGGKKGGKGGGGGGLLG